METTGAERFLFLCFIGLAALLRGAEMWRKQGTERGATTMRWSLAALVGAAGMIYVGTVVEFLLAARVYRWGWGVAGMVLYGLSVGLRLAAIRALGRYWSLHIEIRQQQPLINTGPYRWVRHPAYAAFLLEMVGVPLAGNAWWALAGTLGVYLPLLAWRIRREEAALVAKFGEAYRVFQRETGQLVPRWGGRGRA